MAGAKDFIGFTIHVKRDTPKAVFSVNGGMPGLEALPRKLGKKYITVKKNYQNPVILVEHEWKSVATASGEVSGKSDKNGHPSVFLNFAHSCLYSVELPQRINLSMPHPHFKSGQDKHFLRIEPTWR